MRRSGKARKKERQGGWIAIVTQKMGMETERGKVIQVVVSS